MEINLLTFEIYFQPIMFITKVTIHYVKYYKPQWNANGNDYRQSCFDIIDTGNEVQKMVKLKPNILI
jgi:hypothetical protein